MPADPARVGPGRDDKCVEVEAPLRPRYAGFADSDSARWMPVHADRGESVVHDVVDGGVY